jgi:creatinine amidohydrolase
MRKHLFNEMTWEEVNDAVRERRVVVVPVAAIEQHGKHLPIDTDNLFVVKVAEEAARLAPDVLLCAPAIHYGFNEHNMDFPGTISIEMETLLNFAFQVGQSLARQGFDRIVWLNGHGSNGPIYNLVARKVTNLTTALSASIDWWSLVWPKIKEVCEGFPEGIDHACEFETSVYLHLRPDLVKCDRIEDDVVSEKGGPRWLYPNLGGTPVQFMNFWSRMSDSGVSGQPSLATPSKGEQIYQYAVQALADVAHEFRDVPVRPRIDYKVRAAGQ